MSTAAIETDLVRCPEPGCGFTLIRPVGVVVSAGGVATDVSHAGTLVRRDSYLRPPGDAGIRLQFQCDAGHDFTIDFRHHEGQTGFEIMPLGDSAIVLPTIWRD